MPPLKTRTPIYTYYDSETKKDDATKKVEHDLLLVWRRAWWAKGFKPVVLGRPEAINNPLYRTMQNLDLEADLEADLLRWLAWGNMGTGILANWLVLPMAPHNDPLISFLRRGEFPTLLRYEGMETGMYAGDKTSINKVIERALKSKQPIKANNLEDIVPRDSFNVDPKPDSIAFYSTTNILKKYKGLAEKLQDSDKGVRAEGYAELPGLITSHLHATWQSTFSSGIAVLKPLPLRTTNLVFTATELARNLSQCAESPYPSTCPPNNDRCKPCVSSHPMRLGIPQTYKNSTSLFTIGTVPHPYTLASLLHDQSLLSPRYIRRQTNRDEWILAASTEFLGTGRSSFARLTDMKDAVASDHGMAHTLWLTAERADNSVWREDLAWIFGFPIPTEPADDGKSETPVPGPERRPPPPVPEGGMPDPTVIAKEKVFFNKAKDVLRGKATEGQVHAKEVIEAWNLADVELWRFVRAFAARRRVERKKWEEDERAFAGSEAKGSWGRWFDDKETADVAKRR